MKSLVDRPGPAVGITEGASQFVPGEVRYPFLIIRNDGRPVNRKTAKVWVAKSRSEKPFQQVTAVLEPIGVPGQSDPAFGGVTKIYVAHVRIRRPGRYWVLVQPKHALIQGLGVLDVAGSVSSVAVGAKAPPSRTPTLATAPAAQITTSRPPDLALLRYSIAESLAAHKPFVVTFATPKFCTSRTCGPVVDVLQAVRRRYERRGVRFIHRADCRNALSVLAQTGAVSQRRLAGVAATGHHDIDPYHALSLTRDGTPHAVPYRTQQECHS